MIMQKENPADERGFHINHLQTDDHHPIAQDAVPPVTEIVPVPNGTPEIPT